MKTLWTSPNTHLCQKLFTYLPREKFCMTHITKHFYPWCCDVVEGRRVFVNFNKMLKKNFEKSFWTKFTKFWAVNIATFFPLKCHKNVKKCTHEELRKFSFNKPSSPLIISHIICIWTHFLLSSSIKWQRKPSAHKNSPQFFDFFFSLPLFPSFSLQDLFSCGFSTSYLYFISLLFLPFSYEKFNFSSRWFHTHFAQSS